LALGKEGPLVHTGACIASLIGQVRLKKPFTYQEGNRLIVFIKITKFLSAYLALMHKTFIFLDSFHVFYFGQY